MTPGAAGIRGTPGVLDRQRAKETGESDDSPEVADASELNATCQVLSKHVASTPDRIRTYNPRFRRPFVVVQHLADALDANTMLAWNYASIANSISVALLVVVST